MASHHVIPNGNGAGSPMLARDQRYFAETGGPAAADLLSKLLNTVMQGIAMFDADRKLVLYNQHFPELFGYPEGFLRVGMPLEEILEVNCARSKRTAAETERYIHERLAAVQSKEPSRREHIRPDGRKSVV